MLVILGNQLFPIEELKNLGFGAVFMAEDRGLCTHFKYHKQKIVLFLSAMRKYRDELKSNGYKVIYSSADDPSFAESFEEKLKLALQKHPGIQKLSLFEIEDKFFEQRLKTFSKNNKLEISWHQSPMFMTSRVGFETYLKKSKKPFMKTFYQDQRKNFSVLLDKDKKPLGGAWSYDAENRKKMPKTVVPPGRPVFLPDTEVESVMKWVGREFADHPGDLSGFGWPVTRQQSLELFENFLQYKLLSFGDYQDAITQNSDFNFHSLISPALNMGLLTPQEIVTTTENYYLKNKKLIPLNSVEGFIRQILGWREFVRGIYQNFSDQQWQGNFWNNQRKMKSCWYTGETGVPVLDDSILRALRNGYGHHIERLMVLSNMMLLSELHPHEVYRWFMEMYCDSSDWVMGPNVFGMGQFSDGGIFATKPYICGSNYYLKMSDYKKGDWTLAVDGLYWRFIDKHQGFYKKNPRMSVMVKSLEKMDKARRREIFAAAENFIERTTDAI